MKRRIQFFLICLAAALFLGQRAAAAESPYVVEVWNTDDGLRQSSVIAMTQTRDGYLWLGTLNGLLRFDGNSFTPFNINNTPELPGNGIVFLFEDSRTNLWVGTDNGGLCLIHDGNLKKFDVSSGRGKITAAVEDGAGTLWFATDDYDYFSWQSNVLEHVSGVLRDSLTDVALHGRLPSRDGSYWYLRAGLVEKRRDDLRIGSYGAVPWGSTVVTAVCEDGEGNLVVGTRGAGVFWYDKTGHFQRITKAEGLSEDYILSLCFDSEKNLWVGTDGGGLDRVKRKYFSMPDGLADGVALSAAEDGRGGMWTTFNFRGVDYWLTNLVQHYGIGTESLAGPVLVDGRQQIWAGTSHEGLFHFESGKFNPVPETDKIGSKVYALFQGRDGTVWVGGRAGLGRFNGPVWSFYSTVDGLPPNAVRALAEDDQGTLWIGTDGGGVYLLHDGKISPTNAPVKDISCLLVDRDGVLWAGTKAHGLARRQNGNWAIFTEDDGLVNDVGYLIEDDLGNLWIGSYEGLLRAGKKSLADFAVDHSRKISCRTFLTHECSAGTQPAAVRTHDGKFWFPTTEGFVSVNPAELRPNTNLPPVVIESVLVDGVRQNISPLSPAWPGAVMLTPENEQLEIHFTALNFSAPKRAKLAVQFRYQLEGNDKKPKDIGDTRVAYFSKLPPGNYTFRVTACNEDGVWNETGASLAITVEPPFWRTPGFIILGALLLL
ncbi:MAG TPA: two-component regulator propeller domain-containing protein, partial [Candidatus Acidoferrales bacterium]|nr:two-component regulator propeller domain-containing protein [Candidatus Acidoferrales bacterium]